MTPDPTAATLAMMKPDELYPSWRLVDLMEQRELMPASEA
jgi:hypothetical protein